MDLNSFLVFIFRNQYCESDLMYLLFLVIILYVGVTFVEGVIPETREVIYQRHLLSEEDAALSND